jgi:serine protease Do
VSTLQDLSSAIQHVAEATGPSIVGIGRRRRGSGVVIGDGHVLTNAHNIRGDEVTVTFADGRSAVGRVAGADYDGDLAVIDVDTSGAKALEWGKGDELALGSIVFGVSATSTGGPRVTLGTVSAVARAFPGPGGRRIAGSIEHTAPLAPGSSGGPILDADGRFLGLNTNRLDEGFYLALPADAALRARVDALGRGESVERPRLGVAVVPSHVARRLRRLVGLADRDGVLIQGVEEGGPAARAGIVDGDLIVSVAGKPVTDADELVEAMAAAGDTFEVQIVRGAEDRTVTVGGAATASGEA